MPIFKLKYLTSLLELCALASSMQEASWWEYILNIYIIFFKVTDFQSALQKYCKETSWYILFFTLVGEKESTSMCFMHTNQNSIHKNKSRGSGMRSTSICLSGACVKLGQVTWDGKVVGRLELHEENCHLASHLSTLRMINTAEV